MSMLRAFRQATAWSGSDYVCLCCRRRLLLSPHDGRRTLSTEVASPPEPHDDWFSNLNDLSTDPLAQHAEPAKSERKAKVSKGITSKKSMTRRERLTKTQQPDFSSLKSNLTSQLGSNGEGRADVQRKEDKPSIPNEKSTAFRPSGEAGIGDLGEKPVKLRYDGMPPGAYKTRKLNIYPVPPAAAVGALNPSTDEEWESVTRELVQKFRTEIPEMIEQIANKKSRVASLSKQAKSKFEEMYDAVIRSRYQGAAVADSERAPATHRDTGSPVQENTTRDPQNRPSSPHTPLVRRYTSNPPTVKRADDSSSSADLGFLDEMPRVSPGPSDFVLTPAISHHKESQERMDGMNPLSNHQHAENPSRSPRGKEALFRRVACDMRGSDISLSDEPAAPKVPVNDGSSGWKELFNSPTVENVNHSSGSGGLLETSASSPWSTLKGLHPPLSKKSSTRSMSTASLASNSTIAHLESNEATGMSISEAMRSGSKSKPPAKRSKSSSSEKETNSNKSSGDSGSKKGSKKIKSTETVKHSKSKRRTTFRKHAAQKSTLKYGTETTRAKTGKKPESTPRRRRRLALASKGSKKSSTESQSESSATKGESETANPQDSIASLPDAFGSEVTSIEPTELEISPLAIPQPAVPGLQYDLDRVLFNRGVFQLQDPHSRVYNFDPYLQKIMPVMEFDYNALKQYKTSSQDTALSDLAKEHAKRYIGSTSSMTGTLGHFHYLISAFRPLTLNMLSRSFPDSLETFTQINRAPNAIFLRSKGDGIYAIDADKEHDGANVLMMLGKSMEKLLTLPREDYERYRKENSHQVTDAERNAPEAFQYTTMGDFLMRSQLDAHDPRLPGTGMFDLKTRAAVSVRMSTGDYEPMTGYEISKLQGRFHSFEREYYDMIRSTMLKYMLQVRMGRMDGIFLAYHNVERIFGFQYVPLHEIDHALHSQMDPCLGDAEFKASLEMLNKVLNKATAKFPDQSLRLHFEASQEQLGSSNPTTVMWVYAEPMAEEDINRIQASSHDKIAEFERTMMGIEKDEPEPDPEKDGLVGAADEGHQNVEDTATRPPEGLSMLPDNGTSSVDNHVGQYTENDYSRSTADGDPAFAAQLKEQNVANNVKPLFAASVICKSWVDGEFVERPKNLKPNQKWKLEYLLQEWDASESTWARYEDMKERRRSILRPPDRKEEETTEENGGEPKKKDGYVEFLKSMSRAGRTFRDKMDEMEAGKVPVVLGQPVYGLSGSPREKVEDLDDYLGWLYAPKAQE